MKELIDIASYYTGLIVLSAGGILLACFILFVLFKWSLDLLGRVFPNMRIIIEYSIYRKDYLEWVRDKERLPIKKKN